MKKENVVTENTFVKKNKICLLIEKSFDEAAIKSPVIYLDFVVWTYNDMLKQNIT